jgi:hypothetical protein
MNSEQLIKSHLLRLIDSRQYPKTICPSEVARALSKDELATLEITEWRDAMEAVRKLAFSLRDQGKLDILQKGELLQNTAQDDVKGPIRLRKTVA